MAVSGTNFGKAAVDYGKHRAGFPDSFFERLAGMGIGTAGQAVLDLGTGTGTLARGFALRGCEVTGLDPDGRMLTQAKMLDEQAGVSVRYIESAAEAVSLPSETIDLVIAGQSWHWFDADGVLARVQRLLKPDGYLVIAHFDWLPMPGNVVAATESLIESHNPAWHLGGGNGIYTHYLELLGAAGMTDLEMFAFDVGVAYSHEDWRGRIRSSAGIAALDNATMQQFDQELEALLIERFPMQPLSVPHRVFAVIAGCAT